MFGGCCCCRDVYFWNNDSALDQFRTRNGITTPKIVSRLINYPWYAVDYHNRRVAVIDSVPPRRIGITPSLKLQTPAVLDNVSGVTVGGFAQPMAMAVDWVHQRIYYMVQKDFAGNHVAIRSIDYSGANHVEIYDQGPIPNPPFSDAHVSVYLNFLNYEPSVDRIFFMRVYVFFAGDPPAAVNHFQVCSIFTDGSGFAVDVELPDLVAYEPGFLAFPINKILMRFRFEAFEASTEWSLSAFDLSTGAETKVLTSTDNGTDPFYQFVCPQYCNKDGKLYFCRKGVRFPSPINDHVTYERCNLDGSNQEVLFSFAGDTNPFNWSNDVNSIFRIGCGFEQTGDGYLGVG